MNLPIVDDWNINTGPGGMPASWRVRISMLGTVGPGDYEAVNAVVSKRIREDTAWRPHEVTARLLDDGTVEIVSYTI